MDVYVVRDGAGILGVYNSLKSAKDTRLNFSWIPFGGRSFYSSVRTLSEDDCTWWQAKVGSSFLSVYIERHIVKGDSNEGR